MYDRAFSLWLIHRANTYIWHRFRLRYELSRSKYVALCVLLKADQQYHSIWRKQTDVYYIVLLTWYRMVLNKLLCCFAVWMQCVRKYVYIQLCCSISQLSQQFYFCTVLSIHKWEKEKKKLFIRPRNLHDWKRNGSSTRKRVMEIYCMLLHRFRG